MYAYKCILSPAPKANIDAMFTTNVLLTIVAVYLSLPVLFRTAQVTSLSRVQDTNGTKQVSEQGVVISCYSCKEFR